MYYQICENQIQTKQKLSEGLGKINIKIKYIFFISGSLLNIYIYCMHFSI